MEGKVRVVIWSILPAFAEGAEDKPNGPSCDIRFLRRNSNLALPKFNSEALRL
jgi:hypothetical protein